MKISGITTYMSKEQHRNLIFIESKAANVHLCATIPNFLILEYIPDDTTERCDIIDEPIAFSEGYLEIPNKPGLGVKLRKDGLEKHPPVPWHRPFRYQPDGSAAYI